MRDCYTVSVRVFDFQAGLCYGSAAFLKGGVMRKALVLFAVVFLVLGVAACKKGDKPAEPGQPSTPPAATGKYADVFPVLEKMTAATEAYLNDLDKVQSADDVAAAMNKYTEAMKPLAPKMKEIGEKYPEFNNQENPPAELKPAMDKLTGMMGRMMGALGKVAPYAQDPKVVAAQAAYDAVMGSLR